MNLHRTTTRLKQNTYTFIDGERYCLNHYTDRVRLARMYDRLPNDVKKMLYPFLHEISQASLKRYIRLDNGVDHLTEEEILISLARNGKGIKFIKNPTIAMELTAISENTLAFWLLKNPSSEAIFLALYLDPEFSYGRLQFFEEWYLKIINQENEL